MNYSIVIPNSIKDELLEGLASATSIDNQSFDSPFSGLFEKSTTTYASGNGSRCGKMLKIAFILILLYFIGKILMSKKCYEYFDNKRKNKKYI